MTFQRTVAFRLLRVVIRSVSASSCASSQLEVSDLRCMTLKSVAPMLYETIAARDFRKLNLCWNRGSPAVRTATRIVFPVCRFANTP